MKYAILYGQYPFDILLGTVEAPDDRPSVALNHALEVYKGVVPEGVKKHPKLHYEQHPVVEPYRGV